MIKGTVTTRLVLLLTALFAFTAFNNALFFRSSFMLQSLEQSFDISVPYTNVNGAPSYSGMQQERRIFIVFSSGCSKYQDWQSQVLIHSHKVQKVPGHAIVRLMSCKDHKYKLPPHSNPKYRVVWTPDFDSFFPNMPYSPRNRPGAMAYWLGGQSDDDDIPRPDDVVVAVDPDHIFTSDHLNVSAVSHGHGFAALYGIGQTAVENPKFKQFCNGACKLPFEEDYNPSYGHPQILTAFDALRHAKLWYSLTNQMKEHDPDWQTEMFSNVVAARRLDIQITVEKMMISSPKASTDPGAKAGSEPWQYMKWHSPYTGVSLFVLHYCQKYEFGGIWFSKGKDPYRDIDLLKCNKQSLLHMPQPNGETWEHMYQYRNEPLMPDNVNNWSLAEAQEARNIWFLDKAYGSIKDSLGAYHEDFCQN